MDEVQWFLLAGQSNMAGFGQIGDVEPLSHPNVYCLHNGEVVQAVEPIHDEHERNGVGLGMSFACTLARRTNRKIGVIPSAISGSPVRLWLPGNELFRRAVRMCQNGTQGVAVSGILWHQGETDAQTAGEATLYQECFLQVVGGFRTVFEEKNLPIVAGELGHFLADACPFFETVNRSLHDAEALRHNLRIVSADGLTDDGDGVHFDAVSLREYGLRYADAWLSGSALGDRRV